ncbi:unnamed protein product [Polarella glacialis]|uniref:Phosphodiesterase n=1 Tax=Polarella glacialis TaxID=89957 RepID=A0A813G879_POLGL|nr:unnamed protein product [Polarella glacialis]
MTDNFDAAILPPLPSSVPQEPRSPTAAAPKLRSRPTTAFMTRSSVTLSRRAVTREIIAEVAAPFKKIVGMEDKEPPFSRRKAAPYCRRLIKNKYFQCAMFLALLAALFLPDFWVLADRPGNLGLDIVLSLVLLMFVFELVVQSIGLWRTYVNSFFFWMDLLGAVSLVLDLSYIADASPPADEDAVSNNVIIMRAARVAKLGARAGRFTKLVKLLRFLPGMNKNHSDEGDTAKVISVRLITALSTRTSCLIIVLVMIMPLFSMWTYPEEDWSTRTFMDILEKTYNRNPSRFAWQLNELTHFYDDKPYHPWRVSAKRGQDLLQNITEQLPWVAASGRPERAKNNVVFFSKHLVCEFNFTSPNQTDSLMNVLLLVVVIIMMLSFSLVLSNSVSAIVLRPLEQLLTQVRQMASTIFQSVTDMALVMKEESMKEDAGWEDESDSEGEGGGKAFGNETELLEKVVQKLAVLSEITMNKSVVDPETMQGLGEGDRAVINGFQGGADEARWSRELPEMDKMDSDGLHDAAQFETIINAQRLMVENAGLSLELIDSWNLNPLELDRARNHAAAMYFLGPHNHGIEFDAVVMGNFLQEAEHGYIKSCPYHNWFHAVDVTHAVYRLLNLLVAETYLSKEERFAVLVSAISHDIGHPGLNNTFLIETNHELALRYNDKSPLENLHCAKLFGVLGQPKCNVFGSLSKQQYAEVRKVCIDAILHTDNAQHFTMIKEVQMLYEVNSEILDISHQMCEEDPDSWPTTEAMECFRVPETRQLLVNLFLHTADISNSMKPFRICRIWAWQVLEEFFVQGDAELRLGVPVQALNDREKVNRPFSQVGFIEFLVSPMIFAVIRVFPQMDALAVQMLQNARTWQKHWETDNKQYPSEEDKKALNARIMKLEQRYRTCLSPPL